MGACRIVRPFCRIKLNKHMVNLFSNKIIHNASESKLLRSRGMNKKIRAHEYSAYVGLCLCVHYDDPGYFVSTQPRVAVSQLVVQQNGFRNCINIYRDHKTEVNFTLIHSKCNELSPAILNGVISWPKVNQKPWKSAKFGTRKLKSHMDYLNQNGIYATVFKI